jgi:predicted permease
MYSLSRANMLFLFPPSGLVMVLVIIVSRRCNINPDNVATPIAASLGDLTTLALLSWIASLLFEAIGMLILCALFISIPLPLTLHNLSNGQCH